MLTIEELLKIKGLDVTKKIKIVRHQDPNNINKPIEEFYKSGELYVYQKYQIKDVFKDCEYIVSFIAASETKAKFIGVFKILQKKKVDDELRSIDCSFLDLVNESNFYYELEEVVNFKDYKDRVIIEWGKGTRTWAQLLSTTKEVVEILPKGYVKDFKGYLNFILTYDELKTVIDNPDANKDWHVHLSSVAGIYLIVDSITGKQYIGSAYGREGILGRWKDYAKNGHGDNVLLKQLQQHDINYCKNFRFTILQTLSKSLTNKEVIQWEQLYKEKLGTMVFGLNSN